MRRGRVDETKPAADEFSEADAAAKGGDDRGLGKGLGNGGDPEIGTKEPDEALDHEPLSPKTMGELVASQPEAPNRRGRRTRPRPAPRRGRREAWIFF